MTVYIPRIGPMVAAATGDYSEPVRFLLRIRRLMTRLGRQDEFAREIEELRSTFKRKRNFLKLLDEKLPAPKGS